MEDKSCLMKKPKLSSMLNHQYEDIVNNLFNKKFEIINNNYALPEPETMFCSNPWKIEQLQYLKSELNDVKSRLNNFNFDKWHQHTKQRNKAGDVQWHLRKTVEPELLTQAWCKFYENISCFPLISINNIKSNKFTTIHLCEAPGAFVASLNHWLHNNIPKVQWDWLAMTLNPYYEGNSLSRMINDDRFIIHSLDKWFFGVDNTGDIMNLHNLDELVKVAKEKENILLITADGSIDCMENPGEQESIVAHLHFCEAVAALHLLEIGGSLLLKIFTIFEHQSVCLIYLLSCLFNKVYVNKPATSKEGNSEMYLVCLEFKGQNAVFPYLRKLREHYECIFDLAMFCKDDIPTSFINQIVECSKFFKDQQCEVILNNINTFVPNNTQNIDPVIKQIRYMVAKKYIKNYNVKKLLSGKLKVIDDTELNMNRCINWTQVRLYSESYNDHCKRKFTETDNQLINMLIKLQHIKLDGKIYKFEFSNGSMCELSIKEGKPYTRVLNSKFCSLDVLKIQKSLYDIIQKTDLQLSMPAEEKLVQYKTKISFDEPIHTKILDFKYNDFQSSIDIITKIYDAVSQSNEGDNLVLIGYCLLTQFNVGVLYLLTYTFHSLEWNLIDGLGCVIILKNKKTVETVTRNIEKILDAIKRAEAKEMVILSVFPITVLCDDVMYPSIIEVNSWIIKTYVEYIAEVRNVKVHC